MDNVIAIISHFFRVVRVTILAILRRFRWWRFITRIVRSGRMFVWGVRRVQDVILEVATIFCVSVFRVTCNVRDNVAVRSTMIIMFSTCLRAVRGVKSHVIYPRVFTSKVFFRTTIEMNNDNYTVISSSTNCEVRSSREAIILASVVIKAFRRYAL